MTEAQPGAAPQPYFEIRTVGKQVQLRIHPPEGGRRANLTDIQKELRRREIAYRHETLFEIYKRASNEFEPLASQEITKYDVRVEVSEDGQQALLTVVQPDVGQDQLTPARMRAALDAAGVQKGINYERIREVLMEQKGVEGVLIAQGVRKQDGTDGRIQLDHPPAEQVLVEENTADYRELNLINNVKEGERIATITLPTPGQDGYDVHAKLLRGRPGKSARVKLGRNVRLSEDGTELFAVKAGYVSRRGDKYSVENILEVLNVDSESGNIRFNGVVRVHGAVEDSYTVEAEKGIDVGTTVGKATLRSKGDIRIHGGAFGATLEAEGSIYARFLSECTVKAGGNVILDEYILHSQVVSKRVVKVTREPQGFITGGRIKAGTEIWAPNAGSDVSEVPTAFEVGSGVNVRKRFDALQERIDANLGSFDGLRKNLNYLQRQRETEGVLDAAKKETYDRMLASGRRLIDELLRQGQAHHDLLQELADPEEQVGMVLCSQHVHPGVTIQVQTSRVSIKNTMDNCAFLLAGGVLKAVPYAQAFKKTRQKPVASKPTRIMT